MRNAPTAARSELLLCPAGRARASSAIARRLLSAGSSGELVDCEHSRLTGPRCARPFPMNAARKCGRQMASIKGVMLCEWLPMESADDTI